MTGTAINVATVVAGSTFRRIVMQGVGLVTLAVGISMALSTKNFLLVLGSILIGGIVDLEGLLVSADARLPNLLVEEALREGRLFPFAGYEAIRREVERGGVRLDFVLEKDGDRCLIEVKSVTLVRGDWPSSPMPPPCVAAAMWRNCIGLWPRVSGQPSSSWCSGRMPLLSLPTTRHIQPLDVPYVVPSKKELRPTPMPAGSTEARCGLTHPLEVKIANFHWEEVSAMAKWECMVCGYIYDPAKGDPDSDIPPGTPFEELPDNWICPECGAEKDMFEKIEQEGI